MKDPEMGPAMLGKIKSQGSESLMVLRELDGSAMIMRVKFKTIQIIVFSTGAAVGDNQIDPKRVLRWRRKNEKTSDSGSCLSVGTDLL